MTSETVLPYSIAERGVNMQGTLPQRITETIQQLPPAMPAGPQPYGHYQYREPGPNSRDYVRPGSPPHVPGPHIESAVRETVTVVPRPHAVVPRPYAQPFPSSQQLGSGPAYHSQSYLRPALFLPLDRIHENGHPDIERYKTDELKVFHEYLKQSAEEGRRFRGSGKQGTITAEDVESKLQKVLKDTDDPSGIQFDENVDNFMFFCELSNRLNDLDETLTEPWLGDGFYKFLTRLLPMTTRYREEYLYDQINHPKSYIATNLLLDAGQRATETDEELCCRIGREAVPHLLDIVQDPFFDVQHLNRDDEELKWMARRELIKKVFTMLYNCVRNYPDNRKFFRKHNAWNILLPFLDCRFFILRAKALFILAYIVTEEENIQLNTTDINIEFIVKILRRSMEDPTHYSAHYNFYALEVVEAIKRMAVNDENKDSFIGADVLPHLITMMGGNNSVDERESALNALWVLSFSTRHRLTILNAESCIANIDNCMKVERFTRTCQAIKWNLHGMDAKPDEMAQEEGAKTEKKDKEVDDTEEETKVPPEKSQNKKPSTKKPPHVMISYQWDVQKQIKRVKEILAALGFNVWLDIEQMGGSTLEAMAKAVEDACVVIICFSEKYKDSAACRTEAEYTWKLRKPFVPLKMQTGYNPDGWLGALLGNALYVEMNTLSLVEEQMPLLVRQLDNRGRILPDDDDKDDEDDGVYVSTGTTRIVQSRSASPTMPSRTTRIVQSRTASPSSPVTLPQVISSPSVPILPPRPIGPVPMGIMPSQPAVTPLPPSGRWSPRTLSPPPRTMSPPGRYVRPEPMPAGAERVVEVPVFIEKVVAVPSTAPHISKAGATCVQIVKQWGNNEVVSWLSLNNYSHFRNWFVGYTGEDILELKKIAAQAPEFFFTTLREEFGFKSMLEIIRFKKMLDNII